MWARWNGSPTEAEQHCICALTHEFGLEAESLFCFVVRAQQQTQRVMNAPALRSTTPAASPGTAACFLTPQSSHQILPLNEELWTCNQTQLLPSSGGVLVLPLQTCLAPWHKATRSVLLDPLLPVLCLLWAWHDLPGQPLPLYADFHILPQQRPVVEGTPEGTSLHSSSSRSFRILHPLICPILHGPTGTVHFCHLLWQQILMPILQRNVFLHLL